MARPETHLDLLDYERSPVDIGTINSEHIVPLGDIDMIAAMFVFLDKCKKAGFDVETSQSFGGTTYKVTRKQTEEELDKSLSAAKSQWDYKQEQYNKARVDATAIKGFQRNMLDNFAEREGLDPIDWEAADREIQEQEAIEARAKVIAGREARRNAELTLLHEQNIEAGIDWHDEENEVEANND